MIPAGVQVFVAVEPVDMRFGFERLSGLALEVTGIAARSRALFVFFGKRREAVKIIFFDGTGMCIFYKRLDQGTFKLPDSILEGEKAGEISDERLEALLDAIDIEAATKPKRRRATVPRVH